MTDYDVSGQILKTDKRGRVQVPAARREALLDEFERSGMSAPAFAAHCGIRYPTFASWRQKRRQREEAQGAAALGHQNAFLLVEPVESSVPSHGALEVELEGGVRLHIRTRAEAALAAELIRALRF